MKLPEFIRKLGDVKPRNDSIIITFAQAKRHVVEEGGTVDPDTPHDGPRHLVNFRGFSHGGLSDEGLIAIADEDARNLARKRRGRAARK